MGIPHIGWLADAVHGTAVCWHLGVHAVLHVSMPYGVCILNSLRCSASGIKAAHCQIHVILPLPLIIQELVCMEDICRTWHGYYTLPADGHAWQKQYYPDTCDCIRPRLSACIWCRGQTRSDLQTVSKASAWSKITRKTKVY